MTEITVLDIGSKVELWIEDHKFPATIVGILIEGYPLHVQYKVDYYDERTRKIEWLEEYQFTVSNGKYKKIGLI